MLLTDKEIQYIRKGAELMGYMVYEKGSIFTFGIKEWYAKKKFDGHAFFLTVLNYKSDWEYQIKLWQVIYEHVRSVIKGEIHGKLITLGQNDRWKLIHASYHEAINNNDVELAWRHVCRALDFIDELDKK